MKRYAPFIIIVVVFLLGAGGGTLLLFSKQRALKAEAAEAAAKQAAKPGIGKPGATPPHIRGSTKANVTLEEFGDFECPPCGMLSQVLEQVEKEYGERLRVIFRELPLSMHKHALDAARAAEAAGLQGRFWEMHDMLYRSCRASRSDAI